MQVYKHILVAVDLSPTANIILQKAQQISKACYSTLSIMHVIEPLSMAYGSDVPLDLTSLQEEITQQATEKINKIANSLAIKSERVYILNGYPDQEIHQIIEDREINLVIIGSHGNKGISLLKGSNSTSIMHGLKCDMLAVHIEYAD